MKADEIRRWGEEIGHKYPEAFKTDPPGQRMNEVFMREGVHHDNFGLAILQIQATLEVAAQLAELKELGRVNTLLR